MNSSSLFIYFIFLSFSFLLTNTYTVRCTSGQWLPTQLLEECTSWPLYVLWSVHTRLESTSLYVLWSVHARLECTVLPDHSTSCGPYMPGNVLPDLSKSCGPYMFRKKFLWKILCLKPVISVRSRIIKIPIHWNSIARGQIIRFL